MSGVFPYLIRAYCDWIEDSNLTHHILVDCEKTGAAVPKGFVNDEKIVLKFNDSTSPVIATQSTSPDLIYVLMPMRV